MNFGSGWFPQLRKRPGLSGARSLAEALADHVAAAGAAHGRLAGRGRRRLRAPCSASPTPARSTTCSSCSPRPGATSAACWPSGTTGRRHAGPRGGRVGRPARRDARVDAAGPRRRHLRRGAATVEVPFYKRAQITVSHLARAFDGQGLGRFDDVDRLTAFADNLVPHVLRMAGVLVYDDGPRRPHRRRRPAAARAAPRRSRSGPAASTRSSCWPAAAGQSPAAVDHQLWQRGQSPGGQGRPPPPLPLLLVLTAGAPRTVPRRARGRRGARWGPSPGPSSRSEVGDDLIAVGVARLRGGRRRRDPGRARRRPPRRSPRRPRAAATSGWTLDGRRRRRTATSTACPPPTPGRRRGIQPARRTPRPSPTPTA